MAEKISIVIDAVDNASKVLKGVTGAMSAVGTAAIAAGAVAGAAIVGAAVLGAKSFVQFDDSMREVFTLLPGMTEQAMGEMSEDVLQFSKDMKVVPDEVVPALYQSISAGIPQENVFSFLETAQRAAVGGVTELETAVDGITSVMNAYGAETVNATQASDIMFTGVRLGKTTFGELSSSLFQVIPTAASMGIAFEDVTASLVTLTGQGVPTATATTQLRQLFIEASDSGTVLGKTVTELAGQSFNELIEQGGSVSEILNDVRGTMPDNEFRELFGSVEAMNAALGITGPNFDKVNDNLEQMGDSAGATEEAFNTMNEGYGRGIEGLKAFGAVALIEIGKSLEPLIDMVLSFAEAALPKIQAALDETVIPALERFGEFLGNVVALVSEGGIATLFTVFEDGSSILSEFFIMLGMGETSAQNLATGILTLVDQVVAFVSPITDAVTNLVSFQDVLIGLGAAVAVVVIPIILSLAATILPIIAVFAAVAVGVALLRTAWESNWGGIRDKVAAVIGFIVPLVEGAIAGIKAWWAANGEEILAKASAVWEAIKGAIDTAITTVMNIVRSVLGSIKAFWQDHGDSIKTIASAAMTAIQGIIESVTGFILGIWNDWGGLITSNLQATWDQVTNIVDAAMSILGDIIDAVAAAIQGDWEAFGDAIESAATTAWNLVKDNVEIAVTALETTIDTVSANISGYWETAMSAITSAIQPAIDLIDGILGAAQGLWDWLTGKIFKFEIKLPSLPDWALPGSPLPIHTAWMDFARDLNNITIQPRMDLSAVTAPAQVVNQNTFSIEANYPMQREGSVVQDLRVMEMLRR